MNPVMDRVAAAIDGAGWLPLLVEMVRTPSHPGVPRQEEAVVGVLERWLEARGIASARDEAAPGRPNLIATVEGPRPGPRLILCGHTDTVPLNEDDPGVGLSAEIRDGKLHGRGSADMKGPIAAMAAALVALKETGALAAGAVTLAAVVDEERESLGAERLIASGIRADGAIVGEPTQNRLALGHRGLEWLEIVFHGRAAHGGNPESGISAIAAAARFVNLAEERLIPRLSRTVHPLIGPATFNVGTIRGGDQPSTIPASCVMTVDRRLIPGETYDVALAELRELLGAVEAALPGLTTSIRRMPGGMATMEHVPLVTDVDHPLARAAKAACETVKGRPETPGDFPAWTDGALLARFGGIPSVILGPGDLAVAHSPREFVPLAEVAEAANIYAAAALELCR
jgi:acetylornithine deacetylase/succinyl-diaminopimelate desuccinylase